MSALLLVFEGSREVWLLCGANLGRKGLFLGCPGPVSSQIPWIPLWPVQPLVPISPKNPQGKRAPGRACSCWEGDTAEPFWGSIQGCSHWEEDPGAAVMGGTGWEWESSSQEYLKHSLRMKVLAQPGESLVPVPSLEMLTQGVPQGWLQLFAWSHSHNSRGRWSFLLLWFRCSG